MADARVNAVVVSLNIYSHHTIEIAFGGGFDRADVRHPRVVYQDVDASTLCKLIENTFHLLLIGHVANMR